MKTLIKAKILVILGLLCGLFANATMAQTGVRYAEPVFDEVITTEAIAYSSAIKEGATTPTTLFLDFYEPAGDPLPERPLVITVFGGAFVAGSRDYVDMKAYCTRLAKHGYVAASIDYRLLSFMQLSHTALIRDAYMAAQDVSSAVRFFKANKEHYRIDTDKVFLLGNSAGSIAILSMLFMDESERPAETFEDPDLGSMHSSGYSIYANFSPSVAGAIPHWGGVMDLGVISDEEYVPLCMIHGTDDTTVPYDSGYCYNGLLPNVMPYMYGSHAIAGRLDELGLADYEFHPFEGEEHAFYLSGIGALIESKFDTCFNITRDFLYQHLSFPTSVPESEKTGIQIYPNPAEDLITIRIDEVAQNGLCSLAVVDVMGRIMFSTTVSGSLATVDVSQWPSGVYFIQMEQDGRRFGRKFIKR